MPQLHPSVLCKFCVRLSPGNICPGENLATSTGCILLLLPLPLLPFFAAPAPACPLLCIKHSSCCSLAAANPFIFPGFISSLLMGAGSSLSKLPLFNLPWQGSPFQLRSERAQRRGRGNGASLLFIEAPAQIGGNYQSKSRIIGLELRPTVCKCLGCLSTGICPLLEG